MAAWPRAAAIWSRQSSPPASQELPSPGVQRQARGQRHRDVAPVADQVDEPFLGEDSRELAPCSGRAPGSCRPPRLPVALCIGASAQATGRGPRPDRRQELGELVEFDPQIRPGVERLQRGRELRGAVGRRRDRPGRIRVSAGIHSRRRPGFGLAGRAAPDGPAELATALQALDTWPDLRIGLDELAELLAAVRPWSTAGGLRAIYGAYAERHGKPRWGDKTPAHVDYMDWLAGVFPEARFVHLIRDGRDVALSLRELPFAPGDGSPEAIAELWRDQIAAARRQAATLPHYREVRFEQLVADPGSALAGLCEWLGLEDSPAMLAAHERAAERFAELPDVRRRHRPGGARAAPGDPRAHAASAGPVQVRPLADAAERRRHPSLRGRRRRDPRGARLPPGRRVSGAGLSIGAGVELGERVAIGANVVIHDGTVVGDDVHMGWRDPRPGPNARAALRRRRREGRPRRRRAAQIGAGAILFAGARIGADAIVGDRVNVRELAELGERSVLGHGSALGTGAAIGRDVATGASVWLTSWTTVEDDVRIGAGVSTMNDDTMARLEPGVALRGPTLRRGCRSPPRCC